MPTQNATGQTSGQAVVPIWLIVFMIVLLFFGGLYFDANGGWFDSKVYAPYGSVAELEKFQLPNEDAYLRNGEKWFGQTCALCHNPDGKGKPNQAPPLAGSDWVQGTPERVVRIPLAGLAGPIDVSGVHYVFPAGMTAIGQSMSDDDLADVLSYVRQAWGNKATRITPDQVKAIRAKVVGHNQPWSPEELKQF
jgi:mono/diheme cytochrome c family protein